MPKSLLDGTDEIIDAFVNLDQLQLTPREQNSRPLWQGRGVCIKFAQSDRQFQQDVHVCCLLKALLVRFAQTTRSGKPSPENWRWSPQTRIQQANPSPEVRLERAIARVALDKAEGDPKKADWSNHIPTCASYLTARSDGQTCVDLARRHGNGEFTLFELKWSADNPLSAAVQLLRYFTVYLFTRCHLKELGYSNGTASLLEADTIHLGVLAPRSYYKFKSRRGQEPQRYELGWFEQSVNFAVKRFVCKSAPHGLWPKNVSFAFYQLPVGQAGKCDEIAKAIVSNPSEIKRFYNGEHGSA